MSAVIPEATSRHAWKAIAEERERTNDALHRALDEMTERCRTAEQRVRSATTATQAQARESVVLAIAFLSRDNGTARMATTVPQVLAELAKADALLSGTIAETSHHAPEQPAERPQSQNLRGGE